MEAEVVSKLRRIVECPRGSESEDDSEIGEMEIETISGQHSTPRRKRRASAIKVSQPSMHIPNIPQLHTLINVLIILL